MISFVNFARIASICVGFDLGTLHGYFFHQDFWPNLNFPLKYQIKLVLISLLFSGNFNESQGCDEGTVDLLSLREPCYQFLIMSSKLHVWHKLI